MPEKKVKACGSYKKNACAAPCEWVVRKGCLTPGAVKASPKPKPTKSSTSSGTSPMVQSDKYTFKMATMQATIDSLEQVGKELIAENNLLKDDVQLLWKKLKACNADTVWVDKPELKKRTWGQYLKSFVAKKK